MNRISTVHLRQIACVSAAAFLSTAAPAQAVDCTVPLTRLQQRLLAKSEEGPDALRRFIDIRRAMLQLDIRETAAWAEAWRAAKPACARVVAAEAPATVEAVAPTR